MELYLGKANYISNCLLKGFQKKPSHQYDFGKDNYICNWSINLFQKGPSSQCVDSSRGKVAVFLDDKAFDTVINYILIQTH